MSNISFNEGGPAFPIKGPVLTVDKQGMTLRDYFAAKAMQTLVSDDSSSIRDDVIMAYRIADAMLEIREKELIF